MIFVSHLHFNTFVHCSSGDGHSWRSFFIQRTYTDEFVGYWYPSIRSVLALDRLDGEFPQ